MCLLGMTLLPANSFMWNLNLGIFNKIPGRDLFRFWLKLDQTNRLFTRRLTSIYVTSIYDGDRFKPKVQNEAREKITILESRRLRDNYKGKDISPLTRNVQATRYLSTYDRSTGNTVRRSLQISARNKAAMERTKKYLTTEIYHPTRNTKEGSFLV